MLLIERETSQLFFLIVVSPKRKFYGSVADYDFLGLWIRIRILIYEISGAGFLKLARSGLWIYSQFTLQDYNMYKPGGKTN